MIGTPTDGTFRLTCGHCAWTTTAYDVFGGAAQWERAHQELARHRLTCSRPDDQPV